MSGLQVFVMVLIVAGGFVLAVAASFTDRRQRFDDESHAALLRELSRQGHPSRVVEDWTPPGGMRRP